MPIAFEIQQGLPCVFTNLPNLIVRASPVLTYCLKCSRLSNRLIQEVPAFRDFWYQKGITKFGDHEF